MKRIIIYRGLLVVALLMMASLTRAEVLGIKDLSECPTKDGSILEVKDKAVLISALNNLSPQSVDASPYFQADKNRFVFCMSTDPKWYKYTSITLQPVTLTNSSIYPVVIYGLNVESTLSAPATTLLTTNGNGELALQNLTTIKQDGSSVGLKAPILLQGKTTVLESTVSCDVANTAAAFVVSSDKNTFRKVTINDCAHGLEVAGSYNNFYEVAIQKLATAADQVGEWGVTVSGKLNRLMALQISNYQVGVTLIGETNKISSMAAVEGTAGAKKTIAGQWVLPSVLSGFNADVPLDHSAGVVFKASGTLEQSEVTGFKVGVSVLASGVSIKQNVALGGTSGAVLIGRNSGGTAYAPTLVTGNTFTTVNTIAYADAEDAKARTLLSVEWMGKHVSESDPTVVDRIVGKLLDQTNSSQFVEMNDAKLKGVELGAWLNYTYNHNCTVGAAMEDIPITFKSKGSESVTTKSINKGEIYFDCSFKKDGNTQLQIPLTAKARFMSNTPTASMMSEDVTVADMGLLPTTVLILPGQVVSGEGGGLSDAGGAESAMQGDAGGGSGDAGSAGAGTGSDARTPDTTPMIGEAEAESGGGSAMSGGAMMIGGGAAPAMASPSVGGCGGQMMPGMPAAPSAILWWLAPGVTLWYGRRTFKRGGS